MNHQNKHILIWVFVFLLLILAFNALQSDGLSGKTEKLAFSDFLARVDDKQVNSVKIQGRYIEGKFIDGTSFSTYSADYPSLIDKLGVNGVYIEVTPPDTKMNSLFSIFVSWFPMILLIGVWVFFMRQMQGGSGGRGGPMSFGRSKAKLLSEDQIQTTFADVAGVDEAKEDVQELVEFFIQ